MPLAPGAGINRDSRARIRGRAKAGYAVTTDSGQGVELLPGISDAITKINQALCEAARKEAPVFITGEAGTEKVFAAKLLHSLSPRAAKPLAKVSVTWKLPSDLAGRFRQCDGGTLIV
ncbi:MAG: two-component system, NtrC family, response regulator PilR, partial [Candidatus Sumerlaeota bacterium]|nr:two-component system, NtrC family, response regulator PilR [Candidatus Sumerlaeota bacterium]